VGGEEGRAATGGEEGEGGVPVAAVGGEEGAAAVGGEEDDVEEEASGWTSLGRHFVVAVAERFGDEAPEKIAGFNECVVRLQAAVASADGVESVRRETTQQVASMFVGHEDLVVNSLTFLPARPEEEEDQQAEMSRMLTAVRSGTLVPPRRSSRPHKLRHWMDM